MDKINADKINADVPKHDKPSTATPNFDRPNKELPNEEKRDGFGSNSCNPGKGKRKLSIIQVVGLVLLPFLLSILGALCIFNRKNEVKIPILMVREIWRESSPDWKKPGKYWETYKSTPNVYEDENEVLGIVLHHTAYPGTAENVVKALCDPKNKVSCHVVIDKDGTRYVLAPPEATTWHAGFSKWGNRYRANTFMIGIEYHGNTLEAPLTEEQIESSVEYMAPIIRKYNIKAENIVTHEMIRNAYKEAFPKKKNVFGKVDITQEEYVKVLNALDTANLLK